MTDVEFRVLVAAMRKLQKAFLSSNESGPDSDLLRQAKDIEKQVDHELATKDFPPGFFDRYPDRGDLS